MNRQQPPGPEYQQQMKSVKTESAPVMRQVDVECVAPYREINWQNIGREAAGMSPESVQYSQGLRPPGHLTSFVRMVDPTVIVKRLDPWKVANTLHGVMQ